MFCRLIILVLLIRIIESTGLRAANTFLEGRMLVSPDLDYVVLRHIEETDFSHNTYVRQGNLHTGALYPSSEMSYTLLQIRQNVRVHTASPSASILKPAHNSLRIPHKCTALCSNPLSNYIITI
jgi:hypothetical protein